MLKTNKIKTIALSAISAVFALAALLIFLLLPTSQLANGIEHSAKEALWVLVFAPVGTLLASGCLIFAFLKDSNVWEKVLSRPIVTGITGLSLAFSLVNFGTYLSYTVQQFSLGFVAPYGDTVYELLAVAATVTVILHFLFATLIIIAAKKVK